MKPYLREKKIFGFDDVPENTAFEAGYLVTANSGWRSIRPVIDTEKCVGCKMCMKIGCPAIEERDGKPYIVPESCVGCDLCARVCPFDAIEMTQTGKEDK